METDPEVYRERIDKISRYLGRASLLQLRSDTRDAEFLGDTMNCLRFLHKIYLEQTKILDKPLERRLIATNSVGSLDEKVKLQLLKIVGLKEKGEFHLDKLMEEHRVPAERMTSYIDQYEEYFFERIGWLEKKYSQSKENSGNRRGNDGGNGLGGRIII